MLVLGLIFSLATNCGGVKDETQTISDGQTPNSDLGSLSSPLFLGNATSSSVSATYSLAGGATAWLEAQVNPRTGYEVTLTNLTSNVDLEVFDVSLFSDSNRICIALRTGVDDEACTVVVDEEALYIKVRNPLEVEAEFEAAVAANGNLGSADLPYDIGSAKGGSLSSNNLTAGAGGRSYFRMAVNDGETYGIELGGPNTNNTTWDVYTFGSFAKTTLTCPSLTDISLCVAEPNSGFLYIRVTAPAAGQSRFSISATEEETGGPSNLSEGLPGSPFAIGDATSGSLNSNGRTVVSPNSSYYSVQVIAGRDYTITLRNLSADLSLEVHENSAFTKELCLSQNAGLANESCTLTADNSQLYIKARPLFSAIDFDIRVIEIIDPNEGSPSAPVALGSAAGTTLTAPGRTVDNEGNSYFSVDVTPGQSYQVDLDNLSGDVDLSVYLTAGFGTPDCVSAAGGTNAEQCIRTATGSTMYIRVAEFDGGEQSYDVTITEL